MTAASFRLEWSRPVYDELRSAGPDHPRSKKALGSIVVSPAPDTAQELEELRQIESIVFPGGVRDESESANLLALFSAKKYLSLTTGAAGSHEGS